MKQIIPFFIFLLPTSTSVTAQNADPYAACCGTEPVEYTYEDTYVYVPNVFTPNDDDKNDFFFPYINEKIVGVDVFLIYTDEGDTLLFDRPGFDFKNIKNYGWNGLRYDGTIYEGPFRYDIGVILKSGGLLQIKGRSCRIVCGPKAKVFQTKEGCFYADQADDKGMLDKTKKTKEEGCY